jgi:hypothetical protein
VDALVLSSAKIIRTLQRLHIRREGLKNKVVGLKLTLRSLQFRQDVESMILFFDVVAVNYKDPCCLMGLGASLEES